MTLFDVFLGTGFAILIVNMLCTVYYNVIISYPIYFLVMSLQSELPWEDCNHEWNTDKCIKVLLNPGYLTTLFELNRLYVYRRLS